MNKNRHEAYQIFIFFWATKNYNTLTGMGAIASTGLYNTDKTASNLDSGHARYQIVPNVKFIIKKIIINKKIKKGRKEGRKKNKKNS